MKEFNYKLGHSAGETMTVSELKAELDKYPDDMPVIATWEGTSNFICADDFEIKKFCCYGNEKQKVDCLYIDTEYL